MNLTYSYWHFKQAISPEDCRKILDMGIAKLEQDKSRGINTEAYTHGRNEKGSMPDADPQGENTQQQLKKTGKNNVYVRDSNVAWLNDKWLYDLVTPFVKKANANAGWNWQWDYCENFQFTVYKPDGFYSWHKDGISDNFGRYKRYLYGITPESIQDNNILPSGYATEDKMIGKVRKISVTINLNAPGDYEGGNLKFDFGHHNDGDQFHECEEIRPQGSIIVFPSFLPHCVTPVTKGTRYSLVLWCLGEPFK